MAARLTPEGYAMLVPKAGETIDSACARACKKARTSGKIVSLTFNGDEVYCSPSSYWVDITRVWHFKRELRQLRDKVGM